MVGFSNLLEKRISGKWIAGAGIDDAIAVAKSRKKRGISVLVNYLGESFKERKDVDEAVGTYFSLIDRMHQAGIHGAISIKPSQIGISIGMELADLNYVRIVERAKSKGIFVWVDMEEPKLIDHTIEIYLKNIKIANAGICIQAYLKRSYKDLVKITKSKGIVRLVKGAYTVDPAIGFKKKAEVDANYIKLLRYLFGHSKRFMVATHDVSIIDLSIQLEKKHRCNVTYAMLNGINNKKALELAESGEKVALYLPFGTRWMEYSYRRLREGGHLSLILKSLLSKQSI